MSLIVEQKVLNGWSQLKTHSDAIAYSERPAHVLVEEKNCGALSKDPIKVLYGVQGTGNGHISRAGAMNKALAELNKFQVSWIMSGRPHEKIMCCEEYDWYRGMTFATNNGKIEILNTIAGNNVFQFIRDVRKLCLDNYDLIITDFEPVVSWAAKKQGRKTIGIGHQYAFYHSVPVVGKNRFSELTMKYFAPADIKLGLHWHHFGQPILPPIVDMHAVSLDQQVVPDKVLVYLPFENQDKLMQLLKELPQWNFYIYSSEMEDYNRGNIHTRAISKTGFKNDLVTASALITNSGFELISECLMLGKRILTKPLLGQIEQLSNAQALSELDYATVISEFSLKAISQWLESPGKAYRVQYPDVAKAIAHWINDNQRQSIEDLSCDLWQQTSVKRMIV